MEGIIFIDGFEFVPGMRVAELDAASGFVADYHDLIFVACHVVRPPIMFSRCLTELARELVSPPHRTILKPSRV